MSFILILYINTECQDGPLNKKNKLNQLVMSFAEPDIKAFVRYKGGHVASLIFNGLLYGALLRK